MYTLRALVYPNRSSKIIIQNRLIEGMKYGIGMKKYISTINAKEVEHFYNMKNDWWNRDGVLKSLHTFNPLRVQFVKNGLANNGLKIRNPYLPLEGIKIADVGCGGGIFAENLARIGAQVTGIDPSADLIDIAKKHMELDPEISERITYVNTTIEEFAKKNEDSYDVVVSSGVIEHVEEQELFLKESVRIAIPGGLISIMAVNKTFFSWIYNIVLLEYITRAIPVGTHDWNKCISPDDVQRILDNYGCKTKSIYGLRYNPLTCHWSWTKGTSLMYEVHAFKGIKL